MKRIMRLMAVVLLLGAAGWGRKKDPMVISGLALEGKIEGENIVFALKFRAEVNEKGLILPLVIGDVAYLDGKLPRRSELLRHRDQYLLKFAGTGTHDIQFRFASRAIKDADWRRTGFSIPVASIRKLSVICDRDDLEVRFPGSLNVERQQTKDKKTQVTAYLGIASQFEVRWKPEVKKLDAELVVTCDANTITTASVGALRLDTVFTYRIIQGALNNLALELPNVNITQVRGADIQDWQIDKADPKKPRLLVRLGRPKEDIYRLHVESEMVLPEFPCKFDLPVLAPQDVIRTSGFLMIGTDSAIKLQIDKAAGLTQVDQAAFPNVALTGREARTRSRPSRSTYAYQYANTPYRLALNADDIVTSFAADNRLALLLADNELVLDASVQIEVKDAPAREILIETDPGTEWTITSVTGRYVSEADTDVREEKGKRVIYIPFKKAVSDLALINIRMEKSLKKDATVFQAPKFKVLEARSQRGYLVIAAERGIRLRADKTRMTGLREVHTGSTQMRVKGAQQAFRFKKADWSLGVAIQRTESSIYADMFHLVSLGEGILYSSTVIDYDIEGAPVQEFRIRVPKSIEAMDITGVDIEGWTRKDDVCTVRLQTRIMGNYRLLVSYDRQLLDKASKLTLGDIETIGTEAEVGYIAVATFASLKLPEAQKPPDWVIGIEPDEIPSPYRTLVQAPIIESYKYSRSPHAVVVTATPDDTEQLLGQVSDCIELETILSKDGEAVTTVSYYVKNASKQFLQVLLPEGVESAWKICSIDAAGRRTSIPSQQVGRRLLIPVRRPANPSEAMRIEVTYAQSHGELGFWRSGVNALEFLAPTLPDTHATVANWRFQLPDEWAMAGADSNMTLNTKVFPGGFIGVLKKTWRFCKACLDGWGDYTIVRALSGGISGGGTVSFTRTVNLVGATPLQVCLRVVPQWMGSAGSVTIMLVSAVLGLVIAGLALKKSAAITGLGLTVLSFGIAQAAVGRSVLAVVVVLLLLAFFVRIGGARFIRLCIAGIFRMIAGIFRGTGRAVRRRRRAKIDRSIPVEPDEDSPFEWDSTDGGDGIVDAVEGELEQGGPDGGKEGSAGIRALLLVLALSLFAGMAAGKQEKAATVPIMDSLNISIVGPGTGRDDEKSAKVTTVLEFSAKDPTSFVVIPSSSVLKGYELSSRYLKVTSRREGYVLNVRKRGKYKVTLRSQAPVTEREGTWSLSLYLLQNMKNKVTLTLPETGLDIRSDAAVLFKTAEAKTTTEAEAVFGASREARLDWRPRVRKTKLEKAVFFCEVNTFVGLRSGVVDLTSLVRYQIAQGEIKALKILIPEHMSVTAVRALGLATWSFDPDKRLLDAILEKGVSGDFALAVDTQISCEGLPYMASIGALQIDGAARQRGSIAFAAPDTIQVRVDKTSGLNTMNIEDFSSAAVSAFGKKSDRSVKRADARMTIRRTFRYHQADEVAATVQTERVLPEIRVEERAELTIFDERIMLSTKLDLAIAKSGVFSVELAIPADFDIESLSGRDYSHMDETAAVETMGKHKYRRVAVHFKKQVLGATDLNLVVARMEKGIEPKMAIPRVRVMDAKKHTGRLIVQGERGVRLMVESHQGVDVMKASEQGIRQAGVLVFSILRPSWAIDLKTEVMAPAVKPDILHLVDLTEGMLKCKAHVHYEIENAGIKSFLLRSPVPGITLSVTGRNIASVDHTAQEGVVQVNLHGKVENRFQMVVTYQVPYDYNKSKGKVEIKPLRTLKTEPQKGFLVVTCGGRIQVKPEGVPQGLKVVNAQNIPKKFRAGDLSSAIQWYRAVRPDYALKLSMMRHDSADVLAATINRVRMTSVLSGANKMVTYVALNMTVGSQRFLEVDLPGKEDALWTVLVNKKEVATSKTDKGTYQVPLEEHKGDHVTSVELVYAGPVPMGAFSSKRKYTAPNFNLPLNDVYWDFFVPPHMKYTGFDGTMEKLDLREPVIQLFNASVYRETNKALDDRNQKLAKQALRMGQQFEQAGKLQHAQKAYQVAMNYSLGREAKSVNEDARIQSHALKKQQGKIGLIVRRGQVQHSRNKVSDEQLTHIEGFQGGEYTPDYAQRVVQRLSDREKAELDLLVSKILDQQAAAEGVVTAINITMPQHGRLLRFHRKTLVKPDEVALEVIFKASSGETEKWAKTLWPAALFFLGFWWLAAGMRKRKAA